MLDGMEWNGMNSLTAKTFGMAIAPGIKNMEIHTRHSQQRAVVSQPTTQKKKKTKQRSHMVKQFCVAAL